jgi:radical SAM superfamily enzyme
VSLLQEVQYLEEHRDRFALGLHDCLEARLLDVLENLASLGDVVVHFGIEAANRKVICLVLARDELSTQLQKRPNALRRGGFVRRAVCS